MPEHACAACSAAHVLVHCMHELHIQLCLLSTCHPLPKSGRHSHPVDEALQGGTSSPHELAVPLTAHPSGKAQGFVHLRLAFRPLPADQAAAAARAEMAGRLGGSPL